MELTEQYRAFVTAHRDVVPTVRLIPLTQPQRGYQYVGAQIMDGALYPIVNGAQQALRYDPASGGMTFFGACAPVDFKWSGGCVYGGTVYGFARRSNSLLMLNGTSCTELPCPFHYEQEHHYGGVCTGAGIVYQPPRSTDHLLRWDLSDGSCTKIPVNNGVPCRYCGSVWHPNGYVYFVPEGGLCVLKLDLCTETVTPIGTPVRRGCFNPVVAADGNIYGFLTDHGILKIDPLRDTVEEICTDVPFGSYSTKCGINGKLYSLPGYNNDLWEFDPFDGSCYRIFTMTGKAEVNYAGGAVAQDGTIYGVPVHRFSLICLDMGQSVTIPAALYRAFFADPY